MPRVGPRHPKVDARIKGDGVEEKGCESKRKVAQGMRQETPSIFRENHLDQRCLSVVQVETRRFSFSPMPSDHSGTQGLELSEVP
eukprot:3848666-Amphidinium_carterae.1